MANPSNFQINPYNFRSLVYLYHTSLEPNKSTNTATGLGETVYDGPGPKARVVARAQGLRMRIYDGDGNGNWYNTFSLVFEDERFKGSTLEVKGISVDQGEWAIVGGTGKFARATGVISKKLHEKRNEGKWLIIELAIHAFCPLLKGSPRPRSLLTKIGPWGGNGGTFQDITEAPRCLESITVCRCRGEVVNSIAFSYIDHDGQKRTAGPWGGYGGERYTIPLASSEFVKEVSGTFGTYRGYNVITSLKFVTNVRTHGPLGQWQNNGRCKRTPFTVPVQDNGSVVGFFGRSGVYLDAVGVYVHPF